MRRFIPVLVVSVALTLAAESNPRAFANGPAKWLMTAEEQQVWRDVKGDDEARNLIDLFFARRDPTPGTPLNEFRNEFESRVAYADANFKEFNRRGALTERGRALIVLGFPKNFGTQAAHTSAQFSAAESVNATNNAADPTGGRTMAEKETWEYTHEAATKLGVPKIEVVFIHDGYQGAARRDPQRTDFSMALPG